MRACQQTFAQCGNLRILREIKFGEFKAFDIAILTVLRVLNAALAKKWPNFAEPIVKGTLLEKMEKVKKSVLLPIEKLRNSTMWPFLG